MLITDAARVLSERLREKITPKQIRTAEDKGLMKPPRRVGPFRFYDPADIDAAEAALRRMRRVPQQGSAACVA
jgi:DNA-binding transcriptional MerR regulator